METIKKLFLIDGMALIYRAHFAMIKNPLITKDGQHTSAIFGFLNSNIHYNRRQKSQKSALYYRCNLRKNHIHM